MAPKRSKSHRSNKGGRDVIGAKQDAQSNTRNAKKRDSGNALQFYEERFKNLLALSCEWYWEQDENYRFTRVIGGGVEQTGIELQQYFGTARWDHGAVPIGDDGSWEKHRAVLEARQPFADFVFRRVDARGEIRYISSSGQPVFDERRFTGYRGISRDITASQRVDQLLRLEHMVARCIASADSTSTALITVIRSICETQDWECGRYLRVDEQAGVLRFSECWNTPGDAIEKFVSSKRETVFGPGAGLAGRAWESGQPAWIANIKNDARSLKAAVTLQTGMHCAFHFPVMSEGKTIGVLAFNSRKVREPDDRLLQAVRVIGSQLGQFLQRKQAEEDLRQFRLALDNSADMILLIDRKTMRYVDVNQTACKLLGYSREELLNMGPGELLPESLGELARAHNELIADPSSLSRMRSHFRCRDGSTIPFESTRHVLRSGDNLIIAAICRDIREQLAVEEAQRQQVALIAQSANKDRLLRLFYDLPFVGLAITSPSSKRWLQVNDYMCGMLGYPREELLELAWTETTHPDDLPVNLALFQRLAAGEFDTFQIDKRFLRKDGAIVDTTTEVRCVRRPDGSVETVIIMVQDITERRRAEAEVQKLQEQLREQALHDPLTGLYNRRYLDEAMGRELIRSARNKQPIGIVICDIDHFKLVNDTYGHLVGDEVLRVFAGLLSKNSRGSDIVCRFGGEEFLMFLPDMPPDIAYQRAEQLRTSLAALQIGKEVVRVTASFGVAAFPENGKTSDELIRAADEAMYEAKKTGRNRVVVASARTASSLAAPAAA